MRRTKELIGSLLGNKNSRHLGLISIQRHLASDRGSTSESYGAKMIIESKKSYSHCSNTTLYRQLLGLHYDTKLWAEFVNCCCTDYRIFLRNLNEYAEIVQDELTWGIKLVIPSWCYHRNLENERILGKFPDERIIETVNHAEWYISSGVATPKEVRWIYYTIHSSKVSQVL